MKLAWFAGVDWGSQQHQACVLDAVGKVLGERAFEHGGQGLAEMADWLLSFASGEAGEVGEVGVAIETPRGPVVESLMERGFAVHSMNPKQLDRFRDRFSPAGAKDDRRDARVLASALRTDPHCLRQLEPTDPKVIELREWSRLREDLTRERTRLANRMREQLWRYYPQFLAAIDDDVATPWALDLWRRLPTPTAAQRVREATLARVLKQHCIGRIDAATLRGRLRAPAIRVAPGTAEAAAAHIRLVTERLALVNRQLAHARSQLDLLVRQFAEAAPAEDPNAPAEADPGPSTEPAAAVSTAPAQPPAATYTEIAEWPLLATTVAGAPAGSRGTAVEGATDDFQDLLETRVAELRDDTGLTAVAVAATIDGELAGAAVSGERRRDSGISVTVDDRWHMGSITKSMTAPLLAVLEDDGLLSAADALTVLLPDVESRRSCP